MGLKFIWFNKIFWCWTNIL